MAHGFFLPCPHVPLATLDRGGFLRLPADVLDNLRDATPRRPGGPFLGKARRAVDLAADDPRLRDASRIVYQAIQSTASF